MNQETFFTDENSNVRVKRTIVADLAAKQNRSYLHQALASTPELVAFKALSHARGNTWELSHKRVGVVGARTRLGQAVEGVGSFVAPGNISPFRSPIRSGIARALTPGGGGLRRPRRRNRQARCPEGYQYGGRFTDNQMSTCGQKLFSIPGILGATIAALVRAFRRQNQITSNDGIVGTPIEGGGAPGRVLQSRAPEMQIPRVTPTTNQKARDTGVAKIIKGLSELDGEPSLMVRRDGFVLQPVVSPAVLRTIPDNRDMEDATYIFKPASIADLGKDELGLLSNTGVSNITYVLDGGATLQLKKVRNLTPGERRKLGRTVNAAIKTDNRTDPAARLKYLAQETGDGMKYTEKLPAGKSVADLLSGAKSKPKGSGKTTDVAEASRMIRDGEPLSQISPSILQAALRDANLFKKNQKAYLSSAGKEYTVINSNETDRINAGIAAEAQRYLGLKAPDVASVGSGKTRKTLLETPESATKGGTVQASADLSDVPVGEVAKLLVADMLSDIDNRSLNTLAVVKNGESTTVVPMPTRSELVDLSDIKIRERTKTQISKLGAVSSDGIYGKYYKLLKEEQRNQMKAQVAALLKRARQFSIEKYRERLSLTGELSEAEKTHLNIVATIVDNRVKILLAQSEQIIELLGGGK